MAGDNSDFKKERERSFISAGSAAYLEGIYESFIQDPNTVDSTWSHAFEALPQADQQQIEVAHSQVRQQFLDLAKKPANVAMMPEAAPASADKQQSKVMQMITAYRRFGHHHANLNPLSIGHRQHVASLDLGHYGFEREDLKKEFAIDTFRGINKSSATLDEIYHALNDIYCGSIGIEYMHITNSRETHWIQQYMEPKRGKFGFNHEKKKSILNKIVAAEGLERYLGNRYVGQKRFSLEGGESLIPMLHEIVQRAGTVGIKQL